MRWTVILMMMMSRILANPQLGYEATIISLQQQTIHQTYGLILVNSPEKNIPENRQRVNYHLDVQLQFV